MEQDTSLGTEDVDGEQDRRATRDAAIEGLKAVVETSLAGIPVLPNVQTTWVSFGLLAAYPTVPVEVPFIHVVNFVNEVGIAAAEAGLVDVQFSLTKRTSKAAKDLEGIYGIVVDVDRPTKDPLLEIEKAGVPMPTFAFPSINGFKVAYVGTQPFAEPMFEELAKRATLAFEGGDATSWAPSQMQRLPTCLKATEEGLVAVNFTATTMNAVPFDASPASVPFPFRVLRALGAGALGPADRRRVRDYLEDLGTPAPEEPGSELYASCPVVDAHGSACCYVNTTDDGAISAHCLGGHGGEGAKHWTEAKLAELAGLNQGTDESTRFDPLRHLPVTAGSVEFIRFRLRLWTPVHVDAVVDLLARDSARREAQRLPAELADPAVVLQVYQQRLHGVHGLPPMMVYYERGAGGLFHDDPEHRTLAVTTGNGPNLKANSIELKSTALWQAVVVKTKQTQEVQAGWGPDAVSMLHKLAVGHTHVLAKLGVPAVTTYSLPVAHVDESWTVDPRALNIVAVTLRVSFADIEEVDAIEFFLVLFRAGRLPLASENDVRLFVILLATPLLRDAAPGQLGVFWFIGPPGAGKDFMAEMARLVWEVFAAPHTRVSFDISLAGELEQKRMLEMGKGCVFARAKEAGKRAGMADALIRLAGTDVLPGRGLYKEEIGISNTFTYVAESAEDLPDRREISRRTVQINVTFMDDTKSKGRVIDEVRAASKGIVKNLKRRVETRPRQWFLEQTDTCSRPLVPVALAQLLGATLPAVEGEDLTEVYESMASFIDGEGAEHGRAQLAALKLRRADKVSLEAKTFPSYSLAYFIDRMLSMPGKSELFSPYNKKSRELVNRIQRETDYRTSVAKLGFMPIEIRGKPYALRLEDGRRFILELELRFRTMMSEARAAASAKNAANPTTVSSVTPLEREVESQPATGASDPDAPTFEIPGAALLKKRTQ